MQINCPLNVSLSYLPIWRTLTEGAVPFVYLFLPHEYGHSSTWQWIPQKMIHAMKTTSLSSINFSYLPTFKNDSVEGLGTSCKNGDYPCPQLLEEDWTQRGKRGRGALPRVGMQKLFKGEQSSGSSLRLRYSNTQILKYSNTQILKYSNTQIPKSGDAKTIQGQAVQSRGSSKFPYIPIDPPHPPFQFLLGPVPKCHKICSKLLELQHHRWRNKISFAENLVTFWNRVLEQPFGCKKTS